jgi:predicted DNA-binding antitoxin AbrB/MazE fold protein
MREQIEVVYENGVLRPLGPLPGHLQERQRLTITIETPDEAPSWLADADPTVSLDAVRQAPVKCVARLPSGCMPNARNAEPGVRGWPTGSSTHSHPPTARAFFRPRRRL